jgi:hypothetical protein
VLKAGRKIHRVWPHASGRAANAFNPGHGDADPTRFAPLRRPPGHPEGARIGTLYAAETWGVTREALTGCCGRDAFRGTVLWAEAVYDQFPHIDGLAWMSRQDEAGKAYLFFGDRVHSSELTPGTPRPFSRGVGRRQFVALANRDSVTITR